MCWLDTISRRVLDVLISLPALLLLGPTFLLIAIAIKRDSPGPIFYRGRRAGRDGREFAMLKFRTMYEDRGRRIDTKVTAQGDLRITPVGRKLRDSKANELPQLWNVLVGHMSLVGPRPEDPEIVQSWPEEERRILLSVQPGITSPATVMYRDEEKLLSSTNVMQDYLKNILPSKLRLDSLYVRNRTILTDLDVIFWTAVALLPNMRHWAVPQDMLYWGPFSRVINRYLSWLLVDSIFSLGAVAISGVIWRLNRPINIGLPHAILIATGISLAFSLMNWVFGLNHIEWSRAPASDTIKLAASTSLATLVVVRLNSLDLFNALLPAPVILVAGVLSLLGFTSVRYRERLVTGFASRWLNLRGGVRGVGEKVLIVGAGENGALASWLFGNTSFGRLFSVVGIVDDDPRKRGMRFDGHLVLGATTAIPDLVRERDIGLILFTIDNIHPIQRSRILFTCEQTGARLVLLPGFLAALKKEMRVEHESEHATIPLPSHTREEEFLEEMQTLLDENRLDAARHRLTSYRQGISNRANE